MKCTNSMITRFILAVFCSTITFTSAAQNDTLKISDIEINEILNRIDTLSGERNYHVLLKSVDNETFQVYIWINDRLGEMMFKEAGMNICRFYTYKESLVFIYEYRQCNYNISSKYVRDKSTDPYAYLTESPFDVENGFHQAFLVKRVGLNLKLKELEFIDNDDIEQYIKDNNR